MDQLKENGWEKETHTSDEINEEEIKKVFSIVDRDSSGFLSKKEAKRACKLIADKFGVEEVKNPTQNDNERLVKNVNLRLSLGYLSLI